MNSNTLHISIVNATEIPTSSVLSLPHPGSQSDYPVHLKEAVENLIEEDSKSVWKSPIIIKHAAIKSKVSHSYYGPS